MSGVRHMTVSEDDDGQRLDRWFKRHVPELPYGLAQKLMRKGQVRVDGKRAKADTRLSAGQDIRIPPIEDEKQDKKPAKKGVSKEDAEFIRSLVIYEDKDVIAINKPHGLATQGGTNTKRHVDGMLDALAGKDGVKPRLVHRLDKDTSGVLLLARSSKIATELGKTFKGRDIKKIYWAVTAGVPADHEASIKAPITKAGGPQKEKMVVDDKEGKFAITDYTVLEQAGDKAAFVAFWPRTGRTHQIRVHATLMECPILGDGKYGGPEAQIEGFPVQRQMHLHAWRLILPHPGRKGVLDIQAPLPPELKKTWKDLGFNYKYKGDPFHGE